MKALILCGGKGERLKPLTETLPKPLVPIKGKPILGYIIDHLGKYGINDIVIAAGYKAEKIYSYFKENYTDKNIEIINSGDVDIVKRIQDAADFIQDEFMLIYGDTLSDVDINKLIDFHRSQKSKATITLWPLKSPFGIMEVDAQTHKVTDYKEKPVLDKWINIGYFCFSKEMLSTFRELPSFEEYLSFAVKNSYLHAFKHEGVHITVNTQKELGEAEKHLDKLFKKTKSTS